MKNFSEFQDLYKIIKQKKGLLKFPKDIINDKNIEEILRELQTKIFEKSIEKSLERSSFEDYIEFFNKIFALLRIFVPDGKFFYYYYEEFSKDYELLYCEQEDYSIISSIEEAIEEGIISLVSNLNEVRSFENIYYDIEKTFLTPIPIILYGKKIGIVIGISKKELKRNENIFHLFYSLINYIAPILYSFQLKNQLDKKQQSLSLLIDVTEDLSYVKPIEDNIKGVIKSLSQSINCDISALILMDSNSQLFFKFASKGLYPFIIKRRWSIGEDLFSESINKNLSFIINNMYKNRIYIKTYKILSDQIKSFLVYPLQAVNFKGCFFAGRLKNEGQFSHEEYDLVMTMIKNLGIFLNNISLFNEVKVSYELTTSALASAIEAKDPYTKGHSQRVMRYSLLIGKKLGLNEDSLKTIKLAGLLHDVGKIGIPEMIITKKGPLNEKEYKIMKKHPYIGYLIVKDINYLKKGVPFVLYHHEKLDGSGYPYGLKGDKIPLFARIAAVADYFDALTSDRPYRKGLTFNEAILDIKNNSGKYFDEEIVNAFIEGLKT